MSTYTVFSYSQITSCFFALFSYFLFFYFSSTLFQVRMHTGRAEVISYSFPLSLLARSFFGPYVPTVTKISTDLREKADCKESIPNSAGQNGPSVNFKDNLFPVPILS